MQNIEISKSSLRTVISQLKDQLVYSISTKALIEKAFVDTNWLFDSMLCIDKLFFDFLHENFKNTII